MYLFEMNVQEIVQKFVFALWLLYIIGKNWSLGSFEMNYA